MTKEELQKKREITKEERDKRLVMWSGVIFFMVLIIFLWFLNTKKVFSRINENSKNKDETNEVSEKFEDTYKDFKASLDEIKNRIGSTSDEIAQEMKEDALVEATSSSNQVLEEKNIEILKEKLEASSTEIINEK